MDRADTAELSVMVGEAEEAGDVEGLLRLILECLARDPWSRAHSPPVPGESEILLDVHLDGVQYTLTRLCPDQRRHSASLSPREREIVRLVSKGLPNKAIAAVLDISPWTVATHMRRVFAKLGVNSRAEMVAQIFQCGILAEDGSSLPGESRR